MSAVDLTRSQTCPFCQEDTLDPVSSYGSDVLPTGQKVLLGHWRCLNCGSEFDGFSPFADDDGQPVIISPAADPFR